MTLRTKWPEYKDLNQARKSNFDTFHPTIADAMREQGMESFKHLADRIQWILEQPEMKELFGIVFHRSTYNNVISADVKSRAGFVHSDAQGFTKSAQLVALALEKSPEDLFAHVLEAPVNFEEQDKNKVDVEYGRQIGLLDLQINIEHALSDLSSKQQDVIERRNGLNGQVPVDKATLAEGFERSIATVRRIEAAAIKELKTSENREVFLPYLNDHWSVGGAQAAVDAGLIETVDNDDPEANLFNAAVENAALFDVEDVDGGGVLFDGSTPDDNDEPSGLDI